MAPEALTHEAGKGEIMLHLTVWLEDNVEFLHKMSKKVRKDHVATCSEPRQRRMNGTFSPERL